MTLLRKIKLYNQIKQEITFIKHYMKKRIDRRRDENDKKLLRN